MPIRFPLFSSIWMLIFLLADLSYSHSLSELSYSLINGSCPPVSAETSITGKIFTRIPCKTSVDQFEYLNYSMTEISRDAYLGGLSGLRANAMTCALTQIKELQSRPDSMEVFIDSYSKKLIQIGQEKHRMKTLEVSKNSDIEAQQEYQDSRLRAEVLLQSLQFSETPGMRRIISSITSQIDPSIFVNGIIDPGMERSFKSQIKSALEISKQEIQNNKIILDEGVNTLGRSLSRLERESLAQDEDLVEQYRVYSSVEDSIIKPIACQVDAEYGKGAKYRDRGILAVSILGPAFASGIVRLGGSAFGSALTGAAAFGAISLRTASILKVLSGTAGGLAILNQVRKECLNDASLKSNGNYSLRCEKNIIESIEKDKCILTIIMGGLGAKLIYGSAKQIFWPQSFSSSIKKHSFLFTHANSQKPLVIYRSNNVKPGDLNRLQDYLDPIRNPKNFGVITEKQRLEIINRYLAEGESGAVKLSKDHIEEVTILNGKRVNLVTSWSKIPPNPQRIVFGKADPEGFQIVARLKPEKNTPVINFHGEPQLISPPKEKVEWFLNLNETYYRITNQNQFSQIAGNLHKKYFGHYEKLSEMDKALFWNQEMKKRYDDLRIEIDTLLKKGDDIGLVKITESI